MVKINNLAKSFAGGMNFLKTLPDVEQSRTDVFRTEEATWFVDTCKAFDTGHWETGIAPKNDHVTIVEQYPTREVAEQGHKKWVGLMQENPERELPDINVWEEDDEDE